FEVIKAHRGNDLAKLEYSEYKPIQAALTRLVPGRTYGNVPIFEFRPWHIWDFRAKDGAIEHVVFEVDDTRPHPSSTLIRITVFRDTGELVSESAFHVGHRCYLRAVKLEDPVNDEYPIIAMETRPGPGLSPNILRQFYGRIEDRFDLVRLEDSDGKARR